MAKEGAAGEREQLAVVLERVRGTYAASHFVSDRIAGRMLSRMVSRLRGEARGAGGLFDPNDATVQLLKVEGQLLGLADVPVKPLQDELFDALGTDEVGTLQQVR
jgi:hypothetical protein